MENTFLNIQSSQGHSPNSKVPFVIYWLENAWIEISYRSKVMVFKYCSKEVACLHKCTVKIKAKNKGQNIKIVTSIAFVLWDGLFCAFTSCLWWHHGCRGWCEPCCAKPYSNIPCDGKTAFMIYLQTNLVLCF